VIRDVAVAVLLVSGLVLMLLSSVGVVAMRDPFERLHYTGPAALGGLLVAMAVTVRESFSLIGDKSLAAGVFLVASGTVIVHVTGRTARVRELGDWRLRRGEKVEVEDP
jgi:multisubunit Na+/H+ antiporter MnhG subunit